MLLYGFIMCFLFTFVFLNTLPTLFNLLLMLRFFGFVLFCIFFFCEKTVTGQTVPLVSRQIAAMEQMPELQSAQWGFAMQSANDDKPIVEHESLSALTPASTMKLFTTGAALGLLGSDYVFKTILSHDGSLNEAGVLTG